MAEGAESLGGQKVRVEDKQEMWKKTEGSRVYIDNRLV